MSKTAKLRNLVGFSALSAVAVVFICSCRRTNPQANNPAAPNSATNAPGYTEDAKVPDPEGIRSLSFYQSMKVDVRSELEKYSKRKWERRLDESDLKAWEEPFDQVMLETPELVRGQLRSYGERFIATLSAAVVFQHVNADPKLREQLKKDLVSVIGTAHNQSVMSSTEWRSMASYLWVTFTYVRPISDSYTDEAKRFNREDK